MRTTATTKTRTQATTHANVAQEVSKGTIAAMSAVPGLIGLWAAACFVGGLINAGGPLAFAKSWLQAITGM
jgi:trimethylamine:corrinoid methyltransferase-like protein